MPVYGEVEFEVVWCGAHKDVTLSRDYDRYPDRLSALGGERHASPGPVRPQHPCRCGCGRLVRAGRTWWRGHHTGRRRARGREVTLRGRSGGSQDG